MSLDSPLPDVPQLLTNVVRCCLTQSCLGQLRHTLEHLNRSDLIQVSRILSRKSRSVFYTNPIFDTDCFFIQYLGRVAAAQRWLLRFR